MSKYIFATFLWFSLSFYFGQAAIKAYVVNQVQQVSSINPCNEDYSDLQVIVESIGEARIVMLGEQDHGDAPTFLAKTRLIKYLHLKRFLNNTYTGSVVVQKFDSRLPSLSVSA